ncbi:hypothetical protein [Flavipsychrobacter stenotrophus]|nr:hypothetical protein [Flavipsychrobacter stenotrophus]
MGYYSMVMKDAELWIENYDEKRAKEPLYLKNHFLEEFSKYNWDRRFGYAFIMEVWNIYDEKGLAESGTPLDTDIDFILGCIDGNCAPSDLISFPDDVLEGKELRDNVSFWHWLDNE